jgi:hypothetical protein
MKEYFLNSLEEGLDKAKREGDDILAEMYQMAIEAFKRGYKSANNK